MPSKPRKPSRKSREASVRRVAVASGLPEAEVRALSQRFGQPPAALWRGYLQARADYAARMLAETYSTPVEEIRRAIEQRNQRGVHASAWTLWGRVKPYLEKGLQPPVLNTLLRRSRAGSVKRAAGGAERLQAVSELRQLLGKKRYNKLQRMRRTQTKVPLADWPLVRRLHILQRYGVTPDLLGLDALARDPLHRLVSRYGCRGLLGKPLFDEVVRLMGWGRKQFHRGYPELLRLLEELRERGVDPRKISARELLYWPEDALVRAYIPKLPERASEGKAPAPAAKPKPKPDRRRARKRGE